MILKITLSAAALFFSFGAIAQGKSAAKGKSQTHVMTTTHSTSGHTKSETARDNGATQANAHANANAQANANENSVLNGTTSTTTVKARRTNGTYNKRRVKPMKRKYKAKTT
ncbi:MAG: hypothetical protein ABIQ56_06340 [Chitinophagaceae bacterium]